MDCQEIALEKSCARPNFICRNFVLYVWYLCLLLVSLSTKENTIQTVQQLEVVGLLSNICSIGFNVPSTIPGSRSSRQTCCTGISSLSACPSAFLRMPRSWRRQERNSCQHLQHIFGRNKALLIAHTGFSHNRAFCMGSTLQRLI